MTAAYETTQVHDFYGHTGNRLRVEFGDNGAVQLTTYVDGGGTAHVVDLDRKQVLALVQAAVEHVESEIGKKNPRQPADTTRSPFVGPLAL